MDEASIRSQIALARTGDPDALASVFETLRPDVVRLCRRLLGATDAEDAAHEACLRAQQRLGSYDDTQPFRRWLLSVASNHCIDLLRRRGVEKRLFDGGPQDPEGIGSRQLSALDSLVRSENQSAVQAALERLDERYRTPLILRFMAELDYDSIGEELGVGRNQVATLLFRGKQRLRALLAEEMRP